MRALRYVTGVTRTEKFMNNVIGERCGVKEDVATKVEKGMIRWFGHVKEMIERRLTKQTDKASISGQVGKGPRR